MISGGNRANALPAEASVTVNCRILPDESVDAVQKRLGDIVGDARVQIERRPEFGAGGASPVAGVIPKAVEKVAKEMWGAKVPVISSMQLGGTDSRFLRARGIQAYGLLPLFNKEEDFSRSHGIDERILVSAIKPGLEFQYKLVKELAQ